MQMYVSISHEAVIGFKVYSGLKKVILTQYTGWLNDLNILYSLYKTVD